MIQKHVESCWIMSLHNLDHPCSNLISTPCQQPQATKPTKKMLNYSNTTRKTVRFYLGITCWLSIKNSPKGPSTNPNFGESSEVWSLSPRFLLRSSIQLWKQNGPLKDRSLVGCWTNPFENIRSNWIVSPIFGVKTKKYLKPPTRIHFCFLCLVQPCHISI